MTHARHFTREQANELLATIEPMLRALLGARDRLTDAEARELLTEAAPTNGGGTPGRAVGEAFLEVRELLGGLEAAGVVVRDIDRGLIDFPALRDGREVYLCWQFGEHEIAFWHELEAGFDGRQPLD